MNYFFACLMLIFLKHKYACAVDAFKISCTAVKTMPLDLIESKLGISIEDAYSLVEACGYDPDDLKAARDPDHKENI